MMTKMEDMMTKITIGVNNANGAVEQIHGWVKEGRITAEEMVLLVAQVTSRHPDITANGSVKVN